MDHSRSLPSPLPTGLRGRCPRCGRGRLFDGYLTVRPACETCGLDYGFADSGDGPAFFVMSIVGLVVVGVTMWLEFTIQPAIWVHLLVAVPRTLILSLGMVRPLKGALIALQYQNGAAMGGRKP